MTYLCKYSPVNHYLLVKSDTLLCPESLETCNSAMTSAVNHGSYTLRLCPILQAHSPYTNSSHTHNWNFKSQTETDGITCMQWECQEIVKHSEFHWHLMQDVFHRHDVPHHWAVPFFFLVVFFSNDFHGQISQPQSVPCYFKQHLAITHTHILRTCAGSEGWCWSR